MTSGFCERCGRLVPIGPRGPRKIMHADVTNRQADWYPLPHTIVEEGGPMCAGTDAAIQDHAPDHPVMAPVHTFGKT